MNLLHAVHPEDFKQYDTQKIRSRFLIEELMQDDAVGFTYTHYDRMMVGSAKPVATALVLETYELLRADYFLERRELGIINVGGQATVEAGDATYTLNKLDCLYVGKGVQKVQFSSVNPAEPALLYLLSAPAHKEYPTALLKKEEAEGASMGSLETSNERTIYRYIHKNGLQSCQLVMGLTLLQTGSVWNTIPPHTHDRRMEVYFYFDLPDNQVVFHYMGQPTETRHLLVKNNQAIVSPSWSIHSGGGTSNYGFIWGMAGENLEYTDMDALTVNDLK
jgi:4-deoxy-L-threo-5-hexosulose-uronate ketol-isomerase